MKYKFRPETQVANIFFVGDDTELPQSPPLIVVQTDSKTLEKMTESSYCRDYQRLGLGSSNNSSQRNKLEPFRITTVNSSYGVCLRLLIIFL